MDEALSQTTPFYLLIVYGDIDPEVIGPFADEDQRDNAALVFRRNHGDEDGIFMLSVAGGGRPHVAAYSGAFFEEVDE